MDVNSIAAMSMAMSQAQLLQNVGTAVMDMAMESQTMEVANMTGSLESLANPDVGQNIDLLV